MEAFIQFLIIACEWCENNYVAFRSTGTQWDMDVFLKPAASLFEAMTSTNPWIKKGYRMPWTQVLCYLWWDSEGYEACLYENNFPGEIGTITMIWRFLADHTQWHKAKISVPDYSPWSCMYLNQDYRIVHPRVFLFCLSILFVVSHNIIMTASVSDSIQNLLCCLNSAF
jgi:hypothetical protein